MLQGIREFFVQNGYLEVETPCLIPAPAPEIHIDAVPAGDLYLQTSPELCMKRMLAAGYDRIFQMCRSFRASERGSRHIPEFTLLEWYRTGAGYKELMDECEELLVHLAGCLGLGGRFNYLGSEIHLTRPWARLSVGDAFRRYASMPIEEALEGGYFDQVMVEEIEPRLGTEPVFLYDYPAPLAALARLRPDRPDLAERFELYMGGLELANAFTELTDPVEQERRFRRDQEERRRMGRPVYPTSRRFLDSLALMPPSAGIAFGVDRLVMLFADRPAIDDVVSFTPEEL